MLLTRVLTALALLPLVVAAILWLPTDAIAVVAGGAFAIGAWEWGRLLDFRTRQARAVCAAIAIAGFAGLWWLPAQHPIPRVLMAAAVIWWLCVVLWIARFPRGWEASLGRRPLAAALGVVVLGATFLAILAVHDRADGPALLLLLFVLTWAADTGAYFSGRFLGRHKLAPRVSPGKTWEGAAGGVALATLAAALGGWWLGHGGAALAAWALLGAVVAAISILGDLTISMFKRSAGLKDAGQLFPGHGGILDRLDSLLAAAPVYAAGLAMLPA